MYTFIERQRKYGKNIPLGLSCKKNMKILFCFFCMASAFLIPNITMADEAPKIFGVTHGSVYKEFVMPRWYEPGATATLSINSGDPQPFANGTKISSNGEYELIVSTLNHQTSVVFEIATSIETATINTNVDKGGSGLEIDFQSGTYVATPVFAVWAEDIYGNFIQNLYVSAMPATNIMRYTNDLVLRPQSIPFWAHKNCIEKEYGNGDLLYLTEPDIPIPGDLDAVSGATQKAAFRITTTARTNEINDSRIRIFFEINQSFDSGWYFYAENDSHEEDGTGRFSDDLYFSDSREPAVVYSVDVDLNTGQTYLLGGNDGINEVLPVGYSHYGGRNGELYTDFYADDNGVPRYKFDHAHRMVGLLTVTPIPGPLPLYTGDFDKDGDVDASDLAEMSIRNDLIDPYLQEFASNFGKAGT